MGEISPGALNLALQYCFADNDYLKKEIEQFEAVLKAVIAMEKASMLCVESSVHADLFKAYKGSLVKIANLRKKHTKAMR